MNRTVSGSIIAVLGLLLGACDSASAATPDLDLESDLELADNDDGGFSPAASVELHAYDDTGGSGSDEIGPSGADDDDDDEDDDGESMRIGTNFTYLAPAWTGETVWRDDLPAEPWASGVDPWNEAFLDDSAMYDVIRPMHWNVVNVMQDEGNSKITRWSDRRLPDDPDNFSGDAIGVGGGPGLAYEWQIDLANELGADLWLTVPIYVDDEFFVELAKLLHEQLDPDLQVYVELANEVWNYKAEQNYAAQQGAALGLEAPGKEGSAFDTALRWQAYRSSQMWAAFESVWGEDSDRVINVLAGWSTNPWATQNLHLHPLFEEEGFNPTSALPEAYAIAPYFGGNGLPGDSGNVFDLMRTDLFEHRWNEPDMPSRMQNVIDQHQVVSAYGLDLVAYEGGQHLEHGAGGPNQDPEMYQLYMEYLQAMEPYFDLFVHYSNVAPSHDERSFGTKSFTGQPEQDAPKYRALREFIER